MKKETVTIRPPLAGTEAPQRALIDEQKISNARATAKKQSIRAFASPFDSWCGGFLVSLPLFGRPLA
jgi:hypothetical protein